MGATRPEIWTPEAIVQAVRDGFTFGVPFGLGEGPFLPNAYWIGGRQFSALLITVGPEHSPDIALLPEGRIGMTAYFLPEMVPEDAWLSPPNKDGVVQVHLEIDPDTIDWEMLNRGQHMLGPSMGRRDSIGISLTDEHAAAEFENAVRMAFFQVYGPPRDPGIVERAIRSSFLPEGRKLGWTAPDKDVVVVLTEFTWVQDPYRTEEDFENWNKVVELLESRGWTRAGWDSINAAVHMVFWRPEGKPPGRA